MNNSFRFFSANALLALCLTTPLEAATYHVAVAGSDAADGLTSPTAWQTLAKACERVEAGDTVTVHPGVYFEQVQLLKSGTAEKPIRFVADEMAKNRVVFSGAEPTARAGKAVWGLEDPQLHIVYTRIKYRPARVLADEVDLFPYPSFEELRALTLQNGAPGPAHGFAFDDKAGKLYVRLQAKYGSIDPNQRAMKIAPSSETGSGSRQAEEKAHYNFGVLAEKPAYVELEGFTFETPGLCGVYIRAGNVAVRNCWFIGCPTGISGQTKSSDESKTTNDVVVERCDFSAYPTFADVDEILARSAERKDKKATPLPVSYWAVRSGGPTTYRLGLAVKVGARWKIQRNYIHDCVNGLSSWSLGASRDTDVSFNTFERLVETAVESGDHAETLRVHHNFLKDVYEPFAWNPKGGAPWPGPILFDHNVVTTSAAGRKVWSAMDAVPGCFKLSCGDENWSAPAMKAVPKGSVTAAGVGFVAYNNTILFPNGTVFRFPGLLNRQLRGFRFLNNIVVTKAFTPTEDRRGADLSGMVFDGNIVAPAGDEGEGAGKGFAGKAGHALEDFTKIGLLDAGRRNFGLDANSPALATNVIANGVPEFGHDAGAYPRGASSTPEVAGPQVTKGETRAK